MHTTCTRFCFCLSLALGLTCGAARADDFTITALGPGVQTPAGITSNYETFDGMATGNPSTITTDFNGSGVTGTYTGTLTIQGANGYGGAGGTGNYLNLYVGGSSDYSYRLSLSTPQNYFGMWFSALDAGDVLDFYSGSTLVYSFNAADYIAIVGACPGSAYCGNPNSAYAGFDSGEQYAYLNFYDDSGTFTSVEFTELGNAGFESDNQAVGLNVPQVGTVLNATPEPSGLALLATGVLGVGGMVRRRLRA